MHPSALHTNRILYQALMNCTFNMLENKENLKKNFDKAYLERTLTHNRNDILVSKYIF